jgi:hypothetical protein
MNYVATLAILTSLVGPLYSPMRGGYFQAYKPPIEAKAGDVATGTVVRQDGQTLILNATPCDGDRGKQIVIFHAPFGTKNVEPISCPGGKTFQQVSANQE